jgi:hypothetical protein
VELFGNECLSYSEVLDSEYGFCKKIISISLNKSFFMKKLFSFFAMAVMLFTASCSTENIKAECENEALVSFAVALDGQAATRAISDGKSVNLLTYSVYAVDGQGNLGQKLTGVEGKKVTFPCTETIRLAKNKSYKIVFWAQAEDCKAYTVDAETMKVAINYEGVNNDENRDAFFKAIDLDVNDAMEVDVELRRPFAQLNVGVIKEDWDAAVSTGVIVEQSTVTISSVADGLNLVTGEVTASAAVENGITYSLNDIPTEMLYADVNEDGVKESYYWISMSYLLVNDQDKQGLASALVDAEFSFTSESKPIALKVTSVPVQRNWRTNILGQILTGTINFNVFIDETFDNDYNYPLTSGE